MFEANILSTCIRGEEEWWGCSVEKTKVWHIFGIFSIFICNKCKKLRYHKWMIKGWNQEFFPCVGGEGWRTISCPYYFCLQQLHLNNLIQSSFMLMIVCNKEQNIFAFICQPERGCISWLWHAWNLPITGQLLTFLCLPMGVQFTWNSELQDTIDWHIHLPQKYIAKLFALARLLGW